MKPTFRTYYYIAYEYGWMVRSNDVNGNDRMEMCYAHEKYAKSHIDRANAEEPRRYAKAVELYDEAMAGFHYEGGIENYYGVRGRYYGD